ncbi:MAG: CDP-alcohol phosphatidyltransferase family protein [Candidatus Omnitrophica bacterium]|nr:CDP-alcohol phosphatidyltransferase family protein [Candidatus Omnitrophota bacterium]
MADPIGKFIRVIAKYPGNILAKTRITPNQITFIGFVVNCGVAYFIARGNLSYLAIGILIWAAGFFDALDGSVARLTGKTSIFGIFWDSVLDRYSDSVIYLGILIHFLELGKTNYVILTVIAIIGSLAVSYTRAKAESLDTECEAGLMPRSVRIIVLGAGFCVGQVFWALVIIAFLSHLTVVQRILHVYRKLNK